LWQGDEKEKRVGGVEEDGDQAIQSHDGSAVLAVALGELDPDDDHGNASSTADEGEAGHEGGILRVMEKGDSLGVREGGGGE